MSKELFRTVVVFNKDLPEEEFHKLEKELAKEIVKDPIPCCLHEVKGFGNTKVTKGEQVWHGWCDYFYYSTEKKRADEIFISLQRAKNVTAFETVILRGTVAKKIDRRRRVNVNTMQRTYIKKHEKDYFDLLFI